MHLGQLWAVLPQVGFLQVSDLTSLEGVRIHSVAYDSRRVTPGALFVAIAGTRLNGLQFVADAVRSGAVAVIAEEGVCPRILLAETGPCVPVALVPDAREALAHVSHAFWRQPSRKLDVIGVTGTNGKTTVSKMVQSILARRGSSCGFLGTIGYEIGGRRLPAETTTPASADLARLLQQAVTVGHDSVVMEISSHGADQHRVTGTRLKAAAFTNLSRDHQGYHGDMDAYFLAKRRVFEQLETDRPAVINIADEAGRRMCAFVRSRGGTVVTCGAEGADVRAEDVLNEPAGSRFVLHTPAGSSEVRCELPGAFNVENAATAAAMGIALDVDLADIVEGLESLAPVPGRMERFVLPDTDAVVVVDYAHTHVGLANALEALAEVRDRDPARGRLSVVFGCGGDRDPGRRPRMGRVASRIADHVIVTSDNPRSEDPFAIIRDILDGVADSAEVEIEPDRARAIRKAVFDAGAGDMVLIAGKGHEDYQKFKDVTIPFDDRDQVRKAIEARARNRLQAGVGRARTAAVSL